eukprot:3192761-Lingulodinium_polyedra.AAC.1
MMQSSRFYASAAACKSHTRARHAHARQLARAWNARARGSHTAAATRVRFDRINVQRARNAAQ